MTKSDLEYITERFGIPEEDILWFNSGICYDRIVVKTEESAKKVSLAVCKGTVNGGMFHGMPLGGISQKVQPNGMVTYDVIC